MKSFKEHQSKELDEATLSAQDDSVLDTLLSKLKDKLLADLRNNDVKTANEIAKYVQMRIEKDTKRKGYSRLKR